MKRKIMHRESFFMFLQLIAVLRCHAASNMRAWRLGRGMLYAEWGVKIKKVIDFFNIDLYRDVNTVEHVNRRNVWIKI